MDKLKKLKMSLQNLGVVLGLGVVFSAVSNVCLSNKSSSSFSGLSLVEAVNDTYFNFDKESVTDPMVATQAKNNLDAFLASPLNGGINSMPELVKAVADILLVPKAAANNNVGSRAVNYNAGGNFAVPVNSGDFSTYLYFGDTNNLPGATPADLEFFKDMLAAFEGSVLNGATMGQQARVFTEKVVGTDLGGAGFFKFLDFAPLINGGTYKLVGGSKQLSDIYNGVELVSGKAVVGLTKEGSEFVVQFINNVIVPVCKFFSDSVFDIGTALSKEPGCSVDPSMAPVDFEYITGFLANLYLNLYDGRDKTVGNAAKLIDDAKKTKNKMQEVVDFCKRKFAVERVVIDEIIKKIDEIRDGIDSYYGSLDKSDENNKLFGTAFSAYFTDPSNTAIRNDTFGKFVQNIDKFLQMLKAGLKLRKIYLTPVEEDLSKKIVEKFKATAAPLYKNGASAKVGLTFEDIVKLLEQVVGSDGGKFKGAVKGVYDQISANFSDWGTDVGLSVYKLEDVLKDFDNKVREFEIAKQTDVDAYYSAGSKALTIGDLLDQMKYVMEADEFPKFISSSVGSAFTFDDESKWVAVAKDIVDWKPTPSTDKEKFKNRLVDLFGTIFTYKALVIHEFLKGCSNALKSFSKRQEKLGVITSAAYVDPDAKGVMSNTKLSNLLTAAALGKLSAPEYGNNAAGRGKYALYYACYKCFVYDAICESFGEGALKAEGSSLVGEIKTLFEQYTTVMDGLLKKEAEATKVYNGVMNLKDEFDLLAEIFKEFGEWLRNKCETDYTGSIDVDSSFSDLVKAIRFTTGKSDLVSESGTGGVAFLSLDISSVDGVINVFKRYYDRTLSGQNTFQSITKNSRFVPAFLNDADRFTVDKAAGTKAKTTKPIFGITIDQDKGKEFAKIAFFELAGPGFLGCFLGNRDMVTKSADFPAVAALDTLRVNFLQKVIQPQFDLFIESYLNKRSDGKGGELFGAKYSLDTDGKFTDKDKTLGDVKKAILGVAKALRRNLETLGYGLVYTKVNPFREAYGEVTSAFDLDCGNFVLLASVICDPGYVGRFSKKMATSRRATSFVINHPTGMGSI